MKNTYCLEIENLKCGHCAMKIEERLKKEPNVSNLELNFILKKLKFSMDTDMTETQVAAYMGGIADSIERGVKFKASNFNKVEHGINHHEHSHGHEHEHCHGHEHEHEYVHHHEHSQTHVHSRAIEDGHASHQTFEFNIENLNCGHCASKIEERLRKEPNVENLELNFILKKLKFEMNTDMTTPEVARQMEEIADGIEKGVRFKTDEMLKEHEGHLETAQAITNEVTKKKPINKEVLGMGISLILLIAGAVTDINLLMIVAYIIAGYDVIIQAARNCLKGRMLDENFLMTIATVAAFTIGEYPEAVAVMLFYKIGEYMQGRAVDYSTREIEKAMDIRPEFARLITEQGEKIVDPKAIRIGQIIQVRPGEKVPLDGRVIKGEGTLDTSMLTGESLLAHIGVGDEILSGSINKDGIIEVQVTEMFQDSTVSKILDLIKNASSKKSKSENFITKFARWYTPTVVGLAVLTAIVPSIITGNPQEWIYNSIIFLVVSCPCALVVSVPLGFFAGIGAASRAQILVKGSNYLEELNHIDAIVLDKTGTITKGKFGVTAVIPHHISKDELIREAAIVESGSNHPIARSIVNAYKDNVGEVNFKQYKEMSGAGILAEVEGHIILAGNDKLMKQYNIPFIPAKEIGSHIYVAKDNAYLGCIIVADEVKEDSKDAIALLKKQGIKKVVMLTGDKKAIAKDIGTKVGVDEVYSELLPADKVEKVEELLKDYHVAFVGDGINDAPVLARANIGIAMGGVGSDAAIEASDVVLMTDKLTSIGDVLQIAKRTRTIITENIVFALGIKVIVLVLGALGIANMWLAIFADVGVSLLAVINSIRILGKDVSHMFTMLKNK